MLKLVALVGDTLISAISLLILEILISGGGEFRVGGHIVRMHSVGNLMALNSLLAVARFASANRSPVFGVAAWSKLRLGDAAICFVSRSRDLLDQMSNRRAWLIVGGIALMLLTAKLANAWFYYGFFSGDDVEVQEMSMAALFTGLGARGLCAVRSFRWFLYIPLTP